MGNTGGTITSGVKAQAAGTSKELYKYINLAGGGLLVELMKKASRTKDYSEVDKIIQVRLTLSALCQANNCPLPQLVPQVWKFCFLLQEELKRFMYNEGEGKWVPIQELVELRCGRPGPKRSNNLSEVRDMEAMTSDNNIKSGAAELQNFHERLNTSLRHNLGCDAKTRCGFFLQ